MVASKHPYCFALICLFMLCYVNVTGLLGNDRVCHLDWNGKGDLVSSISASVYIPHAMITRICSKTHGLCQEKQKPQWAWLPHVSKLDNACTPKKRCYQQFLVKASASSEQIQCKHLSACSGCTHADVATFPTLERAVQFFADCGHTLQLEILGVHGWRARARLAVRDSSQVPRIGLFKAGK